MTEIKITKYLIKKFETALNSGSIKVSTYSLDKKRATVVVKYANGWKHEVSVESKVNIDSLVGYNTEPSYTKPDSTGSGVIYKQESFPPKLLFVVEKLLPLVAWTEDEIEDSQIEKYKMLREYRKQMRFDV